MCSRFSTRRPRLCTIWTAVAPEAVFTRRTKAPTPRDYPRRQAPLVTTSAPIHGQTPTSAAPTITRSPERYKSGPGEETIYRHNAIDVHQQRHEYATPACVAEVKRLISD